MTDKLLEQWWKRFEDIPVNNDGELEQGFDIPESGHFWSKGTDRESIWEWFDMHHSRGVYALMFPNDTNSEGKVS